MGHILANLFKSFCLERRFQRYSRGIGVSCYLNVTRDWGTSNTGGPYQYWSFVLRLYTSLLARRVLDSCAASGCSENYFLLSATINHAKKERRQPCVTFLDLAKAFETVSHKHFLQGESIWVSGAFRWCFWLSLHWGLDSVPDWHKEDGRNPDDPGCKAGRSSFTIAVKYGDGSLGKGHW